MPVRNIAVRCLSLAVPTGIGKMTEFVTFACNICGTGNTMPRDQLERDTSSCLECGSTMRLRAMIHILSTELFGESLVAKDFPVRTDIVGIGLSDWGGYAKILA